MAIKPEILKNILETAFPGGKIEVIDTAGDNDHFDVKIAWAGFTGKNMIAQHRMVQEAVKGYDIHAISMKTSAA